jgi:phosphatidylserine/phosphatidylglycerophosphate/cardiolipin synthase-like enzyme
MNGMKKMFPKSAVFIISALIVSGCSSSPSKTEGPAQAERTIAETADPVIFFTTPKDLHRTWLRVIGKAQKSIFMEMFHLTDQGIVDALRAKSQQVEITLILDSGNLLDAKTEQVKEQILADRPNIHVYPSSGPPNGFTQTHTKSMIVDGTVALITSINLTNNADIQRDYGIETRDPVAIGEMTKVFNDDIQNSENAQNHKEPVRDTPVGVGQGKLIWSPEGSEGRLVSLIEESKNIPDGANKYLYATVENLGDVPIQNALSDAAKNGVDVRIIVPQCVLGKNGPRNYDLFQFLTNGVHYRVMPHPSSAQKPYMHGKMMALGNGSTYIGSVNYSKNSTQGNRELGIIFTNADVSQRVKSVFNKDWKNAEDVADPTDKPTCPTTTTSPAQ